MYNYLHGQYELWLESPLYKRLQNEIEAESSAFYKLLDQQPDAFELETLANDYVGEAMRAAFLCGLCWRSVHQQAVRQQAMLTPT